MLINGNAVKEKHLQATNCIHYLKRDSSNPLGSFLQTSSSLNDKRNSLVYDRFGFLWNYQFITNLENKEHKRNLVNK